MSRITKKKYVVEEVLNKYDVPSKNQTVVQIVRSCGNNLHEVVSSEGQKFLVSMPTRFRKHIWIKRGDFVVMEPVAEGVKVKGEIAQILLKDQIKYFKNQGVWPKGFSDGKSCPQKTEDSQCDDDELFVNNNRPCVSDYSTSSSDDED